MNNSQSGFGSRIREARKAAQLTQQALADLIGRSQSSINDWEHENAQPSLEYFEMLARATATAPGWLAFGEGGDE